MCTESELQQVLKIFSSDARELFGDKLKSIILYGSYERGDYDNESDIDVMLLVDVPKTELHQYTRPLTQMADKADWNFTTILSPVVKNSEEFERFKFDMPFYRNVDTEGVRLV